MEMALDESNDSLTTLDLEGFTFQYEKQIEKMIEKSVIEHTKSFWGEGLVIRTSGAGAC
ncbi:MAG: hypothetical protein JEZ04_08520 [Spirochaetales bacterium]|nr:hypothetical protein [Spirochaetales bacterium]